ncbi:MAG: hypothetical protein HQM06_02975, partial [Magnetococcales bacterium]|nr:hypothetical protein [Magnetococcales bacterium]
AQGYGHARVLNLSDLREPKSPLWLKQVQQLVALPGGAGHSLFSAARRSEREQLMGEVGRVPVLVGWGRDEGMRPLAAQCRQALHGWRLVGVPVDDEGLFYAHPSPMLQRAKERWLQEILQRLS